MMPQNYRPAIHFSAGPSAIVCQFVVDLSRQQLSPRGVGYGLPRPNPKGHTRAKASVALPSGHALNHQPLREPVSADEVLPMPTNRDQPTAGKA
jgi:hypothetical protein